MSFSRAAVLALVVALVAPHASAQDAVSVHASSGSKSRHRAARQKSSSKKSTVKKAEATPADDDLLVPMAPKKRATAKRTRPAPADDDLLVPMAPKRRATAKKVKPAPAPTEDDLLVPITPEKSELLVKLGGGVKGARLLVDNKDVGALPMSGPLSLDSGEHTIVVRRPGFNDYSRRVVIQKDKPTELAVSLEAVAAVVLVNADVAGASVTINGQPQGHVPLTGLLLKPGSYEIVVSKEGFEPETKSLAVKAGRDYTVMANLRPAEGSPVVASTDRPERAVLTPPESSLTDTPSNPLAQETPEVSPSQPWFKRWYVWAGVGVVAAAAVGAVVATQGGSTHQLTPVDVCGGQCDGTINGAVPLGAR